MQRALFPMQYVNITQGYGVGTHRDSYAIDNAGKDTGRDPVFAPFDCVVKKIYTADANEVWIESAEPVQYADGTEEYMTILLCHDNDVSDLYVGKKLKQGDVFYQEGDKGNATGNHIHMECGKGKFTKTGWFQNASGYWGIYNAVKPEKALWIATNNIIKNDGGYKWEKTSVQNKPEETKPEAGFAVGDVVTVTGSYASSASGKAVYTAAKGSKRYIVKIISGAANPYQLGAKPGNTASANTTGFAPEGSISKEGTANTGTFKAGEKVKVNSGAKDYNGGSLADFVYKTVFTVLEDQNGSRVVIGMNGTVTAAMNANDLKRA